MSRCVSVPSRSRVASLQRLKEHKCFRLHDGTLVNSVLPLPFRRASLWHLNFGKLRQKQLLRVESLAPGIQQVHALLSQVLWLMADGQPARRRAMRFFQRFCLEARAKSHVWGSTGWWGCLNCLC